MNMYNNFLIIPIAVIFCGGVKSHPNLNFLSQKDQSKNAVSDTKYSNILHEYDSINTQNDLGSGKVIIIIPIENRHKTKQIARLNYDYQERVNQLKAAQVEVDHQARMKEVIDFMKDHMITTKYLCDEVLRIKNTREVKDPLRKMVEYLEKPEKYQYKQIILNLFKLLVERSVKKPSVWDQKVHDTVINTIKDPFNDGVIN